MGNIKEHEGKTYFMVNDFMLETIGIVKFDDIKILNDTDDKLPDSMTYPEFFWADQYTHRTHKDATIGAGQRNF